MGRFLASSRLSRFVPSAVDRLVWNARSSCDVVLISFPKCGRTWLRLMIGRVLAAHFELTTDDPLDLDALSSGHDGIPRVLVTHDGDPHRKAPGQLRRSKDRYRSKRVIFLVRDPRDVIVSLYFEMSKRTPTDRYEGTLSEFLSEPVGSVESLVEFYNIWAAACDSIPEFLLVRYEDMHEDPQRELRRVVDFIGLADVSDQTVSQAVGAATFQKMREAERQGILESSRLRPTDPDDPQSYKTRSGRVGGFREHLSATEVSDLERRLARLDPVYGYSAPAHSSSP